jgi:hypothetical protein
VPGIVPMGPYRYVEEKDTGPWMPACAQQTTHPSAKQWPPHELWFETRKSPSTNGFTVGNIAIAAAAYGSLSTEAPAK